MLAWVSAFSDLEFALSIHSQLKQRAFLRGKFQVKRTKYVLSGGYLYSLSNIKGLNNVNYNHLLPYKIKDKGKIIKDIEKESFSVLNSRFIMPKEINFERLSEHIEIEDKQRVLEFLSVLVAFLTGDGHMHKTTLSFFLREKEDADKFQEYLKSKLKNKYVKLFYIKNVYRVEFYNSFLINLLTKIGAVEGNKVYSEFSVPNWILNGLEKIKKLYLATLIGNEGSSPVEGKHRIQFVMCKNERHLKNLVLFLNQIRHMLYHFGIKTSHIQVRKQKGRQFYGRFYIKGRESIIRFYKDIGFLYASEKQKALEKLVLRRVQRMR